VQRRLCRLRYRLWRPRSAGDDGVGVFTVLAASLRLAQTPLRLLDAMQPSAYGIYLLHYVFIIWLQYTVYDPPLPAVVKFAIVFAGTLSMSWALTVLLRKVPLLARMI
jgi:surface polysaccharide O-acyltransferase-like enzyme